MAASSVAHAQTMRGSVAAFFSVVFLFASAVMAQQNGTVSPTNAPLSPSDPVNQLRVSGGALLDGRTYPIAPLTASVGKGQTPTAVAAFAFKGNIKFVDYTSTSNITAQDIVVASCDPNGSNIDSTTVVVNAAAHSPGAIVLYSATAQGCSLNGSVGYTSIFTLTTLADSQNLITALNLVVASTLDAAIGTNKAVPTPNPSSTSNEGGPAPTTAVAMSILYSITGIITLLFLVIIATGAVRAHRHPERYGPRNGFQGRPRQSRAKGLARAMLETLPIVKFGDPEPTKPGSHIELEDGQARTRTNTDVSVTPAVTGVQREAKPPVTTVVVESGMGAAQAESVNNGDESAVKEGDLGCSICTEDFTTGEDVRVLPCNHKYHPACIDPWLLNVSGTCPLCRHDLRPVTSGTSNTEETAVTATDGDELPPPLSINEGDGNSRHSVSEGDAPHQRRMSRFVDLRRLRNAPPDERIAALRNLREQSQREPSRAEDTEERSRRARLTSRLRDTFRIRTRTEAPNHAAAPSS